MDTLILYRDGIVSAFMHYLADPAQCMLAKIGAKQWKVLGH
jgi:hypothetical protein